MRNWMTKRLSVYQYSVFEEMNCLARRYQAVNLGSGTPDMPVPEAMREAAQRAMADGFNQYSPVQGEGVLRTAIAAHAARFYGQRIDPATEVTVTSGVTEAIHAAMFAFVEPGDEVIVFEPFYDSYVPAIQMAGGAAVPVTLHAPSFRFVPEELRSAFSRRTKAIIVNTPHNPTGTVLTKAELMLIAALCQEFDVLAITDEVYEHIIFDDVEHVRLATLPGMWDRTLTLSGAGKTFSCTGWRIGWAIGPAPLHDALARLRQFTVFSAVTPLQHAVACGLGFPDAYFRDLARQYQERRDLMVQALEACDLRPARPAGSFFILTDTSKFPHTTGHAFCCDMAREVGVVPVPTDTFYLNRRHAGRTVRFTFCQGPEKLQLARERLSRMHGAIHAGTR
jgi:N-succinyldiaminopimelate aminotransferase